MSDIIFFESELWMRLKCLTAELDESDDLHLISWQCEEKEKENINALPFDMIFTVVYIWRMGFFGRFFIWCDDIMSKQHVINLF